MFGFVEHTTFKINKNCNVYLFVWKFECYILPFIFKEHKSQGPSSNSKLVCISPPGKHINNL